LALLRKLVKALPRCDGLVSLETSPQNFFPINNLMSFFFLRSVDIRFLQVHPPPSSTFPHLWNTPAYIALYRAALQRASPLRKQLAIIDRVRFPFPPWPFALRVPAFASERDARICREIWVRPFLPPTAFLRHPPLVTDILSTCRSLSSFLRK